MRFKLILLCMIMILSGESMIMSAVTNRAERIAINDGNKLVKEGKLAEAIKLYRKALIANPQSNVARFNLGLTQINLSKGLQNNDSVSHKLLDEGSKLMQSLTGPECGNVDLRSKANYNCGNLAFENEDFAGAIRYYKQALRLNPDFADARRNLRIAQLKQQNQDNQDQNNQDQNNQDQNNQDNKQDRQENQEQDQQQDQQDNQNQDNQNQDSQPPQESKINQQTAEQILNAVENNENQTRARKAMGNGNKSSQGGVSQRKW